MKGSLSAAEVHKQYSEGVTAFRRQIADATLRVKFTQEADVFLRACALGVWQRDGASLTPRHVEYYNAIYTKGNPAPSILFWELSTAVSEYPGFRVPDFFARMRACDKVSGTHLARRFIDLVTLMLLLFALSTAVSEYPGFRVPDFFARMRACDKVSGTHLARRFIDLVTLMLLLFAAVDDVVSEEEAGFVNTCADTLSALCDRDGLKGEKAPLDVKDFVTRRPAPPKADAPAAAAAPAGAGQAAAAAGEEAEPAPSLEELMAELDGLCGLDKVKADVKSLINLVKVRRLRQEHGLPVAEPAPSLEELMAELDGLCGLDKVKADVKSLINLVKVRRLRQEHGLPVPPMSLHLVFLGNPGTGKTTVARLLAKIYRAIGVLSKGQLVEVDRSGLVAGFVGQTALKTGEVIEKALGGVLFIDEAYALANQDAPNDFGREAIETLLKGMEDHRDDLIVIAAGYTELMGRFLHANPGLESRFNKYFYFEDYNGAQLLAIFQSMCAKNGYTLDELMGRFLHANPGLESRFNKYFYFEDYNGAQLLAIFQSMCAKNGYTLDDKATEYAESYFKTLYEERDENFGNARDVRNVFERAVARQSDRVAALEKPGKEELMALTVADLQEEGGPVPDGAPDETLPESP